MMQTNQTAKGLSLMLSSAFLFAILGVLIKLLGPPFRVWDIAVYRFVGGTIVLLSLFGWRHNLFKPQNLRLMLIRGCTGSMAFLTLVFAIQLIPLSTAMIIFYSFPAFAAVFSPLIFGERVSALDMVCIATTLLGVGIIFDFQIEGTLWGQAAALISGIFAGLTVAIIKKLRENHGSVMIYFYFCIIGSLIAAGPFLSNPQLPRNLMEWIIMAGILFTSITAQLFMNQGFRYCKSWEGGVFMTSELIFISFFGILFLGESTNWRFWTGGLLIIGSAVALNLAGKKHHQKKQIISKQMPTYTSETIETLVIKGKSN
ncbi:MAG: DMT family transporter [Desulfobacterales bacterium]|nr:DMT family transporter [Desulfobacterales bacterium]